VEVEMQKGSDTAQGRGPGARIEGQVRLEGATTEARLVKLKAFAFDRGGNLLGEGDVGPEGKVSLDVKPYQGDVQFVISPADNPNGARETALYSRFIGEKDWTKQVFTADVTLEEAIWWPIIRHRYCISGHVRKVTTSNGVTSTCPVSYVKVEIFDVDREWCWWSHLVDWWKYLDRRVIRIPELIRQPKPKPFPEPDPGPIRIQTNPLGRVPLGSPKTIGVSSMEEVMLNPQPLPPKAMQGMQAMSSRMMMPGSEVMFNPQPDPPREVFRSQMRSAANLGFLAKMGPEVAEKLSDLTLTSRIPPWLIFPRCFYSRREICETYTDCDGFFRCCFRWFPSHYRNGHYRYDPYPDIILKVTQVISGVETVIYMDPYTNTRWNSTNAHIDLFLDDEEVVCSAGCGGSLEGTSQAAMLQLGSDAIWTIDQADGKYHTGTPNFSNGAYQGTLTIKGDFSADLKQGPKRYYRLSWALDAAVPSFSPIQTPLSVLRAVYLGTFEPYLIGPNPTPGPLFGLYEVQDLFHWWINPGPGGAGITLGYLESLGMVLDEGAVIIRMEVFDDTGVLLSTIQFPNHGGNGTGLDPNPVPIVVGHQDLKVYIDNKPMDFSLTTPATNACGVVVWTPTLTLDFNVHAEQENGRVHSWSLQYVKGVDPTQHLLGSNVYPAGLSPVNEVVNGNVMLTEPVTASNPTGQLQSTCAFALILDAYLHCRNDWGWIHQYPKTYAIAIEKCPPCHGHGHGSDAADHGHG
jgi:hypothetical protein